MTQQVNAVIEAPATQQQALAPTGTGNLPGIAAQPSEAELAEAAAKAAAAAAAKEATAIARFDTTIGFKLEGELVGATKRKVSKTGAVSIRMGSKKELGLASGGMKGTALEDFTRLHSDKLKEKQSVLAMRLATDIQWTGAGLIMKNDGKKIVLEYNLAPAMKVTEATEPTDEVIAKALGKSVEAVKQMKLEAKQEAEAKANMEKQIRARIEAEIIKEMTAKAIADEKAAKELAEEELARQAKNNGAVGNPEKSDNDTE